MIEFNLPLDNYLANFLINQLHLDDLGVWHFSDKHWLGNLLTDELIYKIDTKDYSNITKFKSYLKVKFDGDVTISYRAFHNINKRIEDRFNDYMIEWVRSRSLSDDDSLKNSIYAFMDYYNLNDVIDMETLFKRFQRKRDCYNIPLFYNIKPQFKNND